MILGALGWIFSVPLEHTRQIEEPDHDHDNSSMQPELAKPDLDSPGRCSIAAAILDSERSQQGWSVAHRGVLGRHTDNAVGSSTACRVLSAPCCGRQTLADVLSRAKHDGVSPPQARWHGGLIER